MISRAHAALGRAGWVSPLALALLSALGLRTPPAEPLTRLCDVRSFTRVADHAAREVDVQALVTYVDAERGMLYLYDATGPGAFAVGAAAGAVRPFGMVSLHGVLARGSPIARLGDVRLTVLGRPSRDPMPEPRPVTAASLLARDLGAEWVELRGVIRSVERREGILHLQLQEGGRSVHVAVASSGATGIPWLPDSRISVRGVIPIADAAAAAGDLPHLLAPDSDSLRLEEDPPRNPFALPPASLAELVQMPPENLPEHRVRVRGSVSRVTGPHDLILTGEGRAVAVIAEEPTRVQAGETVDVVGFVTPSGAGSFLAHALVRSAREVGTRMVVPAQKALRTAAEVRGLSPQEALLGRPVKLEAVVTFNYPERRLLFVQDQTAGIYVEAWRHVHHLERGDRVEIEGVSAPGGFAPIVAQPRVRVLGRGRLPPAKRVRPQELRAGQEDSQWIEVEGVVRAVTPHRRYTAVQMAKDGVSFLVELPPVRDPGLLARLVGAEVRVRAVCRSLYTAKRQWVDIVLSSPTPDDLTVLAPPKGALALPISPVSTLFQFVAGKSWEQRVRVRGTVTFSEPGDVYLRDEGGGLRVRPRGGPWPAVGDEVDAIGFAGHGDYGPVLQDAEVRRSGPNRQPVPVVVTPEEAMRGDRDAELVQLEARLLEHVRGAGGEQVSLRAGPYLFTALLAGLAPWPDELRPGSGLRLTGICQVSAADEGVPQSFQLRLRTPSDIEITDPAPWWTTRRAAWILAVMVGVVALVLTWVATLRRHTAVQSRIIWQRVKRETELQERQRMARELHDTLEQNLTGISLSLEAASLTLAKSPQMAEQHLGRALVHVDRSIEEVHRSVWALREPSRAPHGLAASLAEIGQQLASCSPAPIEVHVREEGGPRPFALSVENNLLRIGQEALTNAVKHGKASRIDVALVYSDAGFCLRVSDDGRGFDVEAQVAGGRLGLVGMRERALEIGGRVSVQSALGRGTQVEVRMAAQPLSQAG